MNATTENAEFSVANAGKVSSGHGHAEWTIFVPERCIHATWQEQNASHIDLGGGGGGGGGRADRYIYIYIYTYIYISTYLYIVFT